MPNLKSRALRHVEYDPVSMNLQVTFTSGTRVYTYYGVPQWKYDELLNANSHGTYFQNNIKDQHSHA